MLLKPFTFHIPKTISEAARLYETLEDVRILAGGTFLLNSLKLLKRNGTKTPSHIISLRKVEEMKGVLLKEPDCLHIKAMTIINDLYESPLLTDNFAVLRTVCKNISTNPIRNMATVGGNLTCRYTWTEMGAVMVALDAMLHFKGADGSEEVVAAEDFFKNAARSSKILSHVSIRRDRKASIAYRRVKKTLNVDTPLLTVCIKTTVVDNHFTDSRVAINTGISFAQRDRVLEDFLGTAKCEMPTVSEALQHLDLNIYDKRSDDYKRHMFRISIKNALEDIVRQKTTS